MNRQLGLRLQDFRKRLGMTREVFAARVGASVYQVEQWEAEGPFAFACLLIAELAGVFGLSDECAFWRERSSVPDELNRARNAISRASVYRGIATSVARKMGLSRAHVFKVLVGRRQSRHIEAALAREIRDAEQRTSMQVAA